MRPLADVANAAKRMKREQKRGIVIGGALILISRKSVAAGKNLEQNVNDTQLEELYGGVDQNDVT